MACARVYRKICLGLGFQTWEKMAVSEEEGRSLDCGVISVPIDLFVLQSLGVNAHRGESCIRVGASWRGLGSYWLGASTRLDMDKDLRLLTLKPLVSHIIEGFHDHVDEAIVVVASKEQKAKYRQVVEDVLSVINVYPEGIAPRRPNDEAIFKKASICVYRRM